MAFDNRTDTAPLTTREIISRKKAIELGLFRYFTGKPCKHGHISSRVTKSGQCYECFLAYRRRWHAETDEKMHDARTEKNREWLSNNREHRNAYMREWWKKGDNYKRHSEKRRVKKIADPRKFLLMKAKERSRSLGLQFAITIDDLPITNVCPVLGLELKYGLSVQNDHSPTLDRIDNSKGYVPGNVKIISWRANNLKSNGSIEEFEKIIDYMKRESGGES